MFNSHPHGQRHGGLIGVFGPLASLVALGATVFLAPSVWPAIEVPVTAKLIELYGWNTAYWLGWLVHVLTYPATFFVIRIGLIGVLTAISAYATNRLI